ncbi:MAG: hypothetical protein ACE5GJ_13965 [Gemmatimonadota bacterium]
MTAVGRNPSGKGDPIETRRMRLVAGRAARRLDVLEWLILAAAGVFAVLGGGVVAVILADVAGFPFRPTWLVASVLIFGVPAAISTLRLRRERTDSRRIPTHESKTDPDHG